MLMNILKKQLKEIKILDMDIDYITYYSHYLNHSMEIKTYGYSGQIFIYFPTQYKRFYEIENEGIIDCLAPYIDSGRIIVVTLDSDIDNNLSSGFWDKRKILERQEEYFHFFTEEFYSWLYERYHFQEKPITFGMSFGAYQAMNIFLRMPHLFNGTFCMSGVYDIRFFFNDYFDDLAFLNSPVDSLNLMNNELYKEELRKKRIIIVVSSGAYELTYETSNLERAFHKNDIYPQIYYWSNEYPHDWWAWKVYLKYYIENLLN